MMFLSTKEINAHSKQSELNTEFYNETQIMVAQRFHYRKITCHVSLAAVFFWIGH